MPLPGLLDSPIHISKPNSRLHPRRTLRIAHPMLTVKYCILANLKNILEERISQQPNQITPAPSPAASHPVPQLTPSRARNRPARASKSQFQFPSHPTTPRTTYDAPPPPSPFFQTALSPPHQSSPPPHHLHPSSALTHHTIS